MSAHRQTNAQVLEAANKKLDQWKAFVQKNPLDFQTQSFKGKVKHAIVKYNTNKMVKQLNDIYDKLGQLQLGQQHVRQKQKKQSIRQGISRLMQQYTGHRPHSATKPQARPQQQKKQVIDTTDYSYQYN